MNIIYLRTSTEEQNPQNQLESCKRLAEKIGVKEYEVIEEKVSGWKEDAERELFDKVKKSIKQKQRSKQDKSK
jgi:DNA invertase Pin-like site-specific DNA recombinase